MPWEFYTVLADAEAEAAADPQLRRFLDQSERQEKAAPRAGCC